MNKIFMIIMGVLVLGLTASNVSAECAVHEKNQAVEYNELSPAEFFYGIPLDNRDGSNDTTRNFLAVIPEDAALIPSDTAAPEFFYGVSVPDRLEATNVICNIHSWGGPATRGTVSSVSNSSEFFGYTNEGNCSNC
jgi:hypothetical protein